MIKRVWWICFLGAFTLAGCTQQGQLNPEKMVQNDAVQRAFSDARLNVVRTNENTRHRVLQNTIREQELMAEDTDLRPQLLQFNAQMNRLMTGDPKGREQLMQSSLTVSEAINGDPDKLARLIAIQTEARRQALRHPDLRKQLLKQNVHEQALALKNGATAYQVKQTALNTTQALLRDQALKAPFLKHNVDVFEAIASTPSLRSEMAEAMLPLLKDPKIASEMEKMMKMMMAQQMKKMEQQMKMEMQKLQGQMKQQSQQQGQQRMEQQKEQAPMPTEQSS